MKNLENGVNKICLRASNSRTADNPTAEGAFLMDPYARTSRLLNCPPEAYQRESIVKVWGKIAAKWLTNVLTRKAGYRSVTIDTALDKRHFSAADIELLQYRQGRTLR